MFSPIFYTRIFWKVTPQTKTSWEKCKVHLFSIITWFQVCVRLSTKNDAIHLAYIFLHSLVSDDFVYQQKWITKLLSVYICTLNICWKNIPKKKMIGVIRREHKKKTFIFLSFFRHNQGFCNIIFSRDHHKNGWWSEINYPFFLRAPSAHPAFIASGILIDFHQFR